MKFLYIATLVLWSNVLYSQTLCQKYKVHRGLKIMSKFPNDTTKINKKFEKASLNEEQIKRASTFFLEKKKYGNLYNKEFRKLCSFYRDSNYVDPIINVYTDSLVILRYLELNGSIYNYFSDHGEELGLMSKRYGVQLKDIQCVQDYLMCCLLKCFYKPEEPEPTEPIDSTKVDESIKNFRQDVTQKVKSMEGSGTVKTEGYFYSKDDTIVVGFDFFHNDDGGFETNKYILENSTVIEEFCDSLLENFSNVLKKDYLVYGAVRGEADGQKFSSNIYKEGYILKKIENLAYTELHYKTQEILNTGYLNLQDGDSITSNLMLAIIRAYYAKEKFQTQLDYNFDEIEAIDYYNSPKREIMIGTEYRKTSFFLVFSDTSYSQIEDFFYYYANYKSLDNVSGTPSAKTLERVMGKRNFDLIKQKK